MLKSAQPPFRLEIMDQGRLVEAFDADIPDFKLVTPEPINTDNMVYITATTPEGEIAGLAKVYSCRYNEALEGIEVLDKFRNLGCGQKLKDAVFRYAAEHTGTLLLSQRTDMGRKYLAKYDRDLAKKFPELRLAYNPGC